MRRWAPTRRAAAHHRPRAGPKTLVGPRPYGACVRPLPLLALARGPGGWATFDGEEVRTWRDDTPPDLSCHGSGARVVVWSATRDLTELAQARALPARVLDLAECHRLRYGGWPADPARVWAGVRGLDVEQVPELEPEDLFAAFAEPLAPEALLTPAGYLRPDAVAGTWQHTPQRLAAWARAVYECGNAVVAELAARGPQALATAISESSAALLCLELERDGLPVDRATMAGLIAQAAGERPRDAAHGILLRAERDQAVLRHAPGHERTDLRNPGAVKELLAAVGIDVPSTRKWVLEPYREAHPLVPALLDWRAQERIATTYGYHWLDTQVGADDRLRGRWTVCDGAAGRMTAENGLHNLPVVLRPGVRAERGHVFVRADLGQIEPRVLACVTGDAAFAAATSADDLYSPVAARLGVDRAHAKVAVLAAMYGQRSGTAGAALAGLQRAYPVAMTFLDQAYDAGAAGADLRTVGGRLIRTSGPADPGARGRYARNALIQGAAAELFKAWAATVRATTADLGAEVVLCLHDELLIHVRAAQAAATVERVGAALNDAARRWSGGAPVRFVTDSVVIQRWSEAK